MIILHMFQVATFEKVFHEVGMINFWFCREVQGLELYLVFDF